MKKWLATLILIFSCGHPTKIPEYQEPPPPAVFSALVKSCSNVELPSFSSNPNGTTLSFKGRVTEIATILFPIPNFRDLTKEDIKPKTVEVNSLGEAIVKMIYFPLFMGGKSINLEFQVADYDFNITGANIDRPDIEIKSRKLFRKSNGDVGWLYSPNNFDCNLNEENLELCREAIAYKISDLDAAANNSTGDQCNQISCVESLLKATNKALKVRPPEKIEPVKKQSESAKN